MELFKSPAPEIEVSGETVMTILKGLHAFKPMAYNLLLKNGISDIRSGKWYPYQAWLDTLRQISETTGPATLRRIGNKIPKLALWPANIGNIHQALASIDKALYMNIRHGLVGHYSYCKLSEHSASIRTDLPNPFAFDYGIIEAVSRLYVPSGNQVIIELDPTQPARSAGGESSTVTISW